MNDNAIIWCSLESRNILREIKLIQARHRNPVVLPPSPVPTPARTRIHHQAPTSSACRYLAHTPLHAAGRGRTGAPRRGRPSRRRFGRTRSHEAAKSFSASHRVKETDNARVRRGRIPHNRVSRRTRRSDGAASAVYRVHYTYYAYTIANSRKCT